MANEFKVKNGLSIGGTTSGITILKSASAASGTLTLPAATDTLVGLATTDTLTNKTLSSVTLTGTVTAGGSVGTNGQILQSTGTGVQWATVSVPTSSYTALSEFGATGISTSTSVYSFATGTYRAAKYFISVTSGTNYGIYEFMLGHDGTNVYFSGNNNDYVTSGTSVTYFAGDYLEELYDQNTRIEIGTMAHSFNWAISGGNLVFSATATSGTINVKGTVTLIKV
jgi:hypothetical protein